MNANNPRLAAIVLAAGRSSRMGEFKPLVHVGLSTAIASAVDTFLRAGIEDVTVVTGYRGDDLQPVVEGTGARAVFNPRYDDGMYSSVAAGAGSLAPEVEACFVLPGDIPRVRPHTIQLLATAYVSQRARIVYPVFQSRRGHPPLIGRSLLDQTLAGDSAGGLRVLLERHQEEAMEVAVLDEGIHLDMDTPADLARVRAFAECGEAPSPAECEAMLEVLRVDDRIVRHSRVVARVAERLARRLFDRGAPVNLALVRAGGLLHDVAKGQPDHAHAGARAMEQFGFGGLARVIAGHTTLDSTPESLDETAIVYLADKLVAGENVITLEQRFARAIARFEGNAGAVEAARRRWETAERVARAIEATTGAGVQEILNSREDAQ